MDKHDRKAPITALLLCGWCLGAALGRAAAQSPPEEIVVTAQKREQNVLDVPVSVAAFSGERLQALGVDNPRDLGSVTPGFVTNENLGFALYSIRGVGSDIFVPSADAGVATYVDGIYRPLPIGLATDFGRLERIEVLKGPQGTLYGRNAVGGAVNIITKKPSDELAIDLRAERGSFDTKKFKGYVSGPLFSDVAAVGISAIHNSTHTFYDPVARSVVQHFADDVTKGVNPRLTLRPRDDFELTISGMYTKFEGPGLLLGTLNPFPLFAPTVAHQGDYQVSRDSDENSWQNEDKVGYMELVWQPGPLGVKLLASRERQRQTQPVGALDYDQSEQPYAIARDDPAFGDIDTAELQLSSTPGGWLSDGFVWTAGAYYYDARVGLDPITATFVNAVPLPGPRVPLPGVTLSSHGILETDSLAGYGQITREILPSLSLTLGARYQVEDRGLKRADSNLVNPDGSETRLANYPLDSATTKRLSPKVTLELRPFRDDLLFYASYQKATKSGTFNVVNFSAPPTEVKPEDVTAYEVGIKGKALDGELRYDMSLYRYGMKNVQAQYVSVTSGGSLNLYNAPHAVSRGFEANVFWWALPTLDPGLELTSGVAVIDAVFDDFPNGSGYDETTGLFFGERALLGPAAPPRDFTGHRMTSSPKLTANLSVNQRLEMPGGELNVGVNTYYSSGFYFDAQNTQRGVQPEYTLVGAHVSYLFEAWNLRATVTGQNLTDTICYRSRFTFDFGTASQFAPPRAIAFSLEWNFH